MLRACAHACILQLISDPKYRSSNLLEDQELEAAIAASLRDMDGDTAQFVAAIEESIRTAESELEARAAASLRDADNDKAQLAAAIKESIRTAESEGKARVHSSKAGSSSISPTAPTSHTASLSIEIMKNAGVCVFGEVKAMPIGIARGSDIRKTFGMVDVVGDGNCGAYALSIVHFAVHGTGISHVMVREKLIELAKHHIDPSLYSTYVTATRVQEDGSARYLEQQELAVFCEALNINCVVFGPRLEGRKKNYTAFSHTIDSRRPYAFFVNTCRGNHYEVVVKLKQPPQGGSFSVLLDPTDAMELLATHCAIIDQPVIESPPSGWFENYEFVSSDFLFTAPPLIRHPIKKPKICTIDREPQLKQPCHPPKRID